ncbi:hypothetical protein SPAR106_1125 [Streptococcus pneumoniae GA47778]|nr:hypothetical protein SPAR45_1180 [Streptococcus pneumoniae GA17371]EHE43348.1 hypothetical protein SPAR106_1125 [Streptococcus pneumoniae GA47778]
MSSSLEILQAKGRHKILSTLSSEQGIYLLSLQEFPSV